MGQEERHTPDLPELIDACRPRSEDVKLPEMRLLAAAIQTDAAVAQTWSKSAQIDELLGRALHDVPIPAGLESRILQAIHANRPCVVVPAAEIKVEPVVRIAVARKWREHWKSWTALSTVCAAAFLLMVLFFFSQPRFKLSTQEDVALQSQRWLGELDAGKWSDTGLPTAEFPFPRQLGNYRPYLWQPIGGLTESLRVVCYDLSPTPPLTHLFVGRTSGSVGLPPAPPASPTDAAGGWCVGGWQAGGIVYVLAVQGGKQRYQILVQPNRTIAAISRVL